jgi:hypothetical protein
MPFRLYLSVRPHGIFFISAEIDQIKNLNSKFLCFSSSLVPFLQTGSATLAKRDTCSVTGWFVNLFKGMTQPSSHHFPHLSRQSSFQSLTLINHFTIVKKFGVLTKRQVDEMTQHLICYNHLKFEGILVKCLIFLITSN